MAERAFQAGGNRGVGGGRGGMKLKVRERERERDPRRGRKNRLSLSAQLCGHLYLIGAEADLRRLSMDCQM